MKKPIHGPSLYYASDKNIFDALNNHKVDALTVTQLFQRRNIIVSKNTPREELAKYFAKLVHDYYDHKDIANRLGIVPRRERITSMDVSGVSNTDEIQAVANSLKAKLEESGDIVQIARNGDNLSMHVQYSETDYKRSEFAQTQVRDGTVEFVKADDGYIVRNTQNKYLGDIRETLLAGVETAAKTPLIKVTVSLLDVPSAKLRSKFFHELASKMPGYSRRDVTDVYVYKAKPKSDHEDDVDEASYDAPDTHVERIFLRGNGVSRSELLNELLDEDNYYITKMGWTTAEVMGSGNVYDIEALFGDPRDCTAFSFILNGVFTVEDGKVSTHRRTPHKSEIDQISRVVEAKARELVGTLRSEFAVPTSEGN